MPDVKGCQWIEVRPTRIPDLVRLITDLGSGEAQVLALALDIPNSLCILDDHLAREIAQLQNLRITGTAGILLKAKQAGFISEVAPLLQKLSMAGFRLSEQVKIHILKLAHE
jgi:predicted nucleic acid-binding protein